MFHETVQLEDYRPKSHLNASQPHGSNVKKE